MSNIMFSSKHYLLLVWVLLGLSLASPVLPFATPYTTSCTFRIDHSNSAGCRTIAVTSVTEHEDESENCFAGSFDGKRQYMFYVHAESPVMMSFGIQFKYQKINIEMPVLHLTNSSWTKVEVEVDGREGMRVKTGDEEVNINCSSSNVDVACSSLNLDGNFKMYLHFKGNVWWTPYCSPQGEPYKSTDSVNENCLILLILLVIVSILLLVVGCYALSSFLSHRGFSVKDRLSFILPQKQYGHRPSVLRPNTRLAIYREDNIFEEDAQMTDDTDTVVSPAVSPTNGSKNTSLKIAPQTTTRSHK